MSETIPYTDKTLIENKHKELGLRPTDKYTRWLSCLDNHYSGYNTLKCNKYVSDYLNAIYPSILPNIPNKDKSNNLFKIIYRYLRAFPSNKSFSEKVNPETRAKTVQELRNTLDKDPKFRRIGIGIDKEPFKENDLYINNKHTGVIVKNPTSNKKLFDFKYEKSPNYIEKSSLNSTPTIKKFLNNLNVLYNPHSRENPFLLRSANWRYGARDVYLNPELEREGTRLYRPIIKKEK